MHIFLEKADILMACLALGWTEKLLLASPFIVVYSFFSSGLKAEPPGHKMSPYKMLR